MAPPPPITQPLKTLKWRVGLDHLSAAGGRRSVNTRRVFPLLTSPVWSRFHLQFSRKMTGSFTSQRSVTNKPVSGVSQVRFGERGSVGLLQNPTRCLNSCQRFDVTPWESDKTRQSCWFGSWSVRLLQLHLFYKENYCVHKYKGSTRTESEHGLTRGRGSGEETPGTRRC